MKRRSARGQLSVITIDQAVAGASNVVIAVLAARLLNVSSFGLFGIVFGVYVLMQGVSRALVSDPLLVHPVEAEGRTGEVIGTSAVLGLVIAVVVALIGVVAWLIDARLGAALVVLGVCAPLLVLQDLGRYLGFAAQKPVRSLVLDVVWLVLVIAAAALLFVFDGRTLPWFIAAWAGSGALAGIVLFAQHRLAGVRLGLTWLRFTWPFSWRYLVSYGSTQGAALAASVSVGGIAGTRALGGIQGALLLVRPFTTFQVAALAATIGEVTRSQERAHQRHQAVRTSVLMVVIAVINGAVFLALPRSVGHAILGDSWDAAQPLLLATAAQLVCLGVVTGVRAGLLGRRNVHRVMVLDVITTVLTIIATVAGALIDGALGAMWAVAAVQASVAVAWWVTFVRETQLELPAVVAPASPPTRSPA